MTTIFSDVRVRVKSGHEDRAPKATRLTHFDMRVCQIAALQYRPLNAPRGMLIIESHRSQFCDAGASLLHIQST